jgi:aldehyde dehydrogenase (NAD+)
MTTRERRIPRSIDRPYEVLIGGEWKKSSTGESFSVRDPFSLEEWASVPECSAEDVDQAVCAARVAFDRGSWSGTSPAVRAAILRNLATLIRSRADELARTQTHENGKLLAEMRGGIDWLAQQCEYSASLGEMLQGNTVETGIPNLLTYTLRQPIGVVAAVTPWNSPLGLLGFKLFPALAAGCTVVVKPSEFTPVSALMLIELCVEAGVPDGVVNVVTGGAKVGAALVEHSGVDKIVFTGSTGTGIRIAETAAQRLAGTALELGGKSPNIVFADADLDEAVHGTLGGIFSATGQTCVAGSRIIVQRPIYEEFLSRMGEVTRRLRLGDPLHPGTQIAPIANRPQFDRVLSYIEIGKESGYRLIAGGRPAEDGRLGQGLFVEPTIFADVDNASRLAREEIFGPVACVMPFDDEADALLLANDTSYGLASGVWTKDIGTAQRMIRGLRAGTVWVNNYRTAHHYMPFAGQKKSGVGQELGVESVEQFTQVKSVWLDYGNSQMFGR